MALTLCVPAFLVVWLLPCGSLGSGRGVTLWTLGGWAQRGSGHTQFFKLSEAQAGSMETDQKWTWGVEGGCWGDDGSPPVFPGLWDGDSMFLSWGRTPNRACVIRMRLESADSRGFWLWEVMLSTPLRAGGAGLGMGVGVCVSGCAGGSLRVVLATQGTAGRWRASLESSTEVGPAAPSHERERT